MPATRRAALCVALGISAFAAAGRAAAQTPVLPDAAAAPAPGVSGRVADAATGEPIGEAFVLLLPLPEGALPGGAASSPASIAAGRRVRTDVQGRYRFQRLAAGSYRLHVSRIGYQSASVDLTVQGTSPDVGVGLVVAPVTLTAVRVNARAPEPMRRSLAAVGSAPADARLAAVRARQARYVSTDVRELTEADVGEAVTLAESDLFRGLQRAPGVSTRDEWSAELWTRGGRQDQTRILWDGLPLFSPYHLFGGLTGVMPEAVGAAFLHPGVRPASLGEGSAGVLDLRSAPGRAGQSLGGRGELSLTSARVAVDGGAGRLAWTAGARRTYWDAVARAARADDAGSGVGIPYSFADGFVRADYSFGDGRSLTASGLAEGDRDRRGGHYGLTSTGGGRWGNQAARVTYSAPVGHGLRTSHTIGASIYGLVIDPDSAHRYTDAPAPALTIVRGGRSVVQYLALRGELTPTDAAALPPAWSSGYELSAQRARYHGPGRALFAGSEYIAGGDTALDGRATVGALWGERRWRPAPRVTVESGLRVEAASMLGRGTVLFPAPRLALRFDADAATRVSLGIGRSVQYTQALPRVGTADAVRFYPGSLWLVAGRDVPALCTDALTLGAERWLGADWLAAANVYVRRADGIVTQDPTPGPLMRFDAPVRDRPLFVTARGAARGVELSARRLAGRTTASVGYTYATSTLDALGYHYFSPQDRRHAVDLSLARRLGESWRLAAAFSGATGAPYTRIRIRPNYENVDPLFDAEAADAERRPPSFLLGTEAEWTHRFTRWQLGAYGQLQSALTSQSSGSYRGDNCTLDTPGEVCVPYSTAREPTFAILPTLGLRFAF